MKPLLSVEDLVIKFKLRGTILTAVQSVSLDIFQGESLAIVGASGSGKSVLTKSLMGLLDNNGWIDGGSIYYKHMDLAKFTSEKEWIKIRGREIALVFQEPMTSLNPLMTVGNQIKEAVMLHQGLSSKAAKEKVRTLLKDVGMDPKRYHQYPHEFSGGMRQRLVIAIAIACQPKLLICDEPTTALDVTIQAEILSLLKHLKNQYDLTIVYITHDLGVVANVADRIAVMYKGDIVETGLVDEIFYQAQHPYTKTLLSAFPHLSVKGKTPYSRRTLREKILSVKNLKVTFGKGKKQFTAVHNVSFDIYQGETFGLVGESGSGKTSIGRAIIGIHKVSGGTIEFKNQVISGKIHPSLKREITSKIQMIFQDPMASLNERAKIDYIVSEGLYNLKNYKDDLDRKQRVAKALRDVGLLAEYGDRFPHEFSGGQRQRIGIARAIVMEPEFIIADEPISALDVPIRAQVLNLLSQLQKEKNLTYLFIAHDLSVMRRITDRLAVIHRGKIVELAKTERLFEHPLHPYTQSLLSAIPLPDPRKERKKTSKPYNQISPFHTYDHHQWVEIEPDHFVLVPPTT